MCTFSVRCSVRVGACVVCFLYGRVYIVPHYPIHTYHPPPFFSLPPAFDGNDIGYSFVANSAREQDEWCSAITTTR